MLCPASAYQRALCGIVEQGLLRGGGGGGGGVRGVSNSLMELRNICNHPFLSRLHPPGGEAELRAHALPPALRLCGKLAVLDRMLLKLTAAGHKVRRHARHGHQARLLLRATWKLQDEIRILLQSTWEQWMGLRSRTCACTLQLWH